MEAADNIDLRGINGSRWRNFGVIGNAEIEIELDKIHNRSAGGGSGIPEISAGYDSIRGNLSIKIKTNFIEFQAIKIQVEGSSAVHYETTVENVSELKPFQYKTHMFLSPTTVVGNRTVAVKKNADNSLSGLIANILRPHDSKEKRTLAKGHHNFPFELKWNGETVPGTLKTQQGRIQYKLMVYIKTWIAEVTAAEMEFSTTGYLNLHESLWPLSLFQPILISRQKTKSFFSSRPVLTADLRLDKRCYIRGQHLPFQLTLRTHKSDSAGGVEQQVISRVAVILLQKVVYTDNNYGKITRDICDSAVMDGVQATSVLAQRGDFVWSAQLFVPAKTQPTFSVDVAPRKNGTVETNYLIQFEVDVKGKSAIRGETAITIGTTREKR